MKTQTKYICDLCCQEYNTEAECTACEASHNVIQAIERADYKCGRANPAFLVVRMEDGSASMYSYVDQIREVPAE